jgi:AmmeMemoRadiSam system protein A
MGRRVSDGAPATTVDAALLDIAEASIRHGLDHGAPFRVDLASHPATLAEHAATFVTLHIAGGLRGCIGSAHAWRALGADVAVNAFGAAFEDPRFDPVGRDEVDALDIDVSVLGPALPIPVESEAELIAALRPGRDGVILTEGARRGLFLPAVWASVVDAQDFIDHLKDKAGISKWSRRVHAERFETRSISRPARGR